MNLGAHLQALITLHTMVVLLALATYALLTLARRHRRHPSAALGWVLFIALAPYVALPLFLLLGFRKTGRRRIGPALAAAAAESTGGAHAASAHFRALASGLGLPPPVPYADLVVHEDGAAALERLRSLMSSARHTLEVSSFLLGRDEVGAMVSALLAQRAADGVRVRLMIDGVGRYLGGCATLRPLRAAGVEVGLFRQPWNAPLQGLLNLRNHRKVAIADGHWLWAGGRNLAAEYFVARAVRGRREAPWTDLSFDLTGPLAGQAHEQFARDWAVATGQQLPAQTQTQIQMQTQQTQAETLAPTQPNPNLGRAGHFTALAQLLHSGPDQSEDTVYDLLIDACFNARHRILATSPYFVPDPVLLMALRLAARRGVCVDLVIPCRSNHRLADLARPPAIRELLDAGARVWLTPAMLHAKLVVVDHTVALSGSLNLDARSLFLNYEMMVAFYDASAIARFDGWAASVMADAQPLRPHAVGALRQLEEGLLRWLTFQL